VEDVVPVLGGVPIYLTTPIRDRTTRLLQKQTGCVTLSPSQALAYVRSRHLEYLNPASHVWITDPTSDFGRISRQQNFLVNLVQRATDRGARNPATALGLVRAGLPAITMDSSLTFGQLLSVAQAMRNLDPDSIQKFQLPTGSGGTPTDSYQVVQWPQAAPIFDIIRGSDVSSGGTSATSSTAPTATTVLPTTTTTAPVGFVPVDQAPRPPKLASK